MGFQPQSDDSYLMEVSPRINSLYELLFLGQQVGRESKQITENKGNLSFFHFMTSGILPCLVISLVFLHALRSV